MSQRLTWALLCGAAVIWIPIAARPAHADPKLDEMQRMIENDHATIPSPAPRVSPKPAAVLGRAWAAVCSKASGINSDLRQQYSLLDHVETDLENAWTSVEPRSIDAISAWPFPHGYWAPGITQDATKTVMDAAERTMESDTVEPDPSPSPAPETE
jgi:hypothetical protein